MAQMPKGFSVSSHQLMKKNQVVVTFQQITNALLEPRDIGVC